MMNSGGTLLWDSTVQDRMQGAGGGLDIHLLSDGSAIMAWHIYERSDNGAPKLAISNLAWDDEGWPELVEP